jgi:hypothetical protein
MPVTLLRFLLQGFSLPRSRIPLGTFYSLAVKRFPPQVLVKSTFNRQPLPFGPKVPTQQAPKSSHCRFHRSAGVWKAACLCRCRESRSLPPLRGPKTSPDWKGYHASHRRPEGLWRSTQVPRRRPPARRPLRSDLALAVFPIARRRSAGAAVASACPGSRRIVGSPWLPVRSFDRRQAGDRKTGSVPGCSRDTRRCRKPGPNDPLLSLGTEVLADRRGMPHVSR